MASVVRIVIHLCIVVAVTAWGDGEWEWESRGRYGYLDDRPAFVTYYQDPSARFRFFGVPSYANMRRRRPRPSTNRYSPSLQPSFTYTGLGPEPQNKDIGQVTRISTNNRFFIEPEPRNGGGLLTRISPGNAFIAEPEPETTDTPRFNSGNAVSSSQRCPTGHFFEPFSRRCTQRIPARRGQ